ncbi:MAG TPA: hypothetical protein VJH55_01545, partial [Candidatus Paceibacterota bacterium]
TLFYFQIFFDPLSLIQIQMHKFLHKFILQVFGFKGISPSRRNGRGYGSRAPAYRTLNEVYNW